jgi:hypothetical protein
VAAEARLDAGLMARRTPIDVNAAALDASSRTTKRARLLRQSLGIAVLRSRSILKERHLILLTLVLFDVLLFVAMPVLLTREILSKLRSALRKTHSGYVVFAHTTPSIGWLVVTVIAGDTPAVGAADTANLSLKIEKAFASEMWRNPVET